MNFEVMKLVRDNIEMGSVLSFTEVMIIQQAIDAAILQGAEPVTTANKLPAIGWLRADYQDDNRGLRGNAPLFVLGKKDPSTVWGLDYIPLTSNSPVVLDGWVACSERMPNDKDYVWCWGRVVGWAEDDGFEAYYDATRNKWWAVTMDGEEPVRKVTHWQPLPSPPAK